MPKIIHCRLIVISLYLLRMRNKNIYDLKILLFCEKILTSFVIVLLIVFLDFGCKKFGVKTLLRTRLICT